MCERTFCPNCGEEMIHRDNRKFYESASALGQIVHREFPKKEFPYMTYIDADGLHYKRSINRLMVLEHKQPTQELSYGQKEILAILHRVIRAAVKEGWLSEQSAVYLVRGDIGASENGRREVIFKGPQSVQLLSGDELFQIHSTAELREWLYP